MPVQPIVLFLDGLGRSNKPGNQNLDSVTGAVVAAARSPQITSSAFNMFQVGHGGDGRTEERNPQSGLHSGGNQSGWRPLLFKQKDEAIAKFFRGMNGAGHRFPRRH